MGEIARQHMKGQVEEDNVVQHRREDDRRGQDRTIQYSTEEKRM
jgi:hypothetical protein